jgi:hypothetical protein
LVGIPPGQTTAWAPRAEPSGVELATGLEAWVASRGLDRSANGFVVLVAWSEKPESQTLKCLELSSGLVNKSSGLVNNCLQRQFSL